MKGKGYLCENCGESPAKYEHRSIFEGRNLLVCFNCLQEMSSVKTKPTTTSSESALYWSKDDSNEDSPEYPSF